MSKKGKILTIPNETSLGESSIPIQVEFEGEIYSAMCAISSIAYQEKVRGVLYFNNRMIGAVGIFPSNELFSLQEKAKKDFVQFLTEQRDVGARSK